MKRKNFFAFLMMGSLSLSMVACSDSSSSEKKTTLEQELNVSTKSCEFTVQDGGVADFSVLSKEHFSLETASFGKPFQPAYLEAVGSANILSTVEFMNRTELVVYQQSERIPTVECSRDLFSFLPTLPSDLNTFWNKAEGPEKESIISGLYLPKDPKGDLNMPSVSSNGAVMVRVNTNRWTLVHEFMHHLFTVEDVRQGYDESKDRANLEAYCKPISQALFASSPNVYETELLKNSIGPCFEAFDSNAIHYSLEELAIEKRLKEEVRAGRLRYVPDNSNWYIEQNANSSKEIYNVFYRAALNLKYSSKGNPSLVSTLDQIIEKSANRIAEVEKIKNQYPHRSSRSMLSGVSGSEAETMTGCSHSHGAFKFDRPAGATVVPVSMDEIRQHIR